jgi:multiple sugar transport system substrate-binding protein
MPLKTLHFLLIVCVLLGSGCGPRNKDDGRTTVVFWHSFVASSVPSLDTLIRQFEETHPTIRIKAQYIPTGDGLVQKLVAANQSGTAPDISWIHTDFLDKLVEAGAILPLDGFIRGEDPIAEEDMQDFFPPLLDAGTYRGVLYAMPMEATSLALLYNRGLFRKAGLDPTKPPATWDELKRYSAKLTVDRDGDGRIDQYGVFVPVFPSSGDLNIWMILQWTPFLWQAGGVEMDPAGSTMLFNSEAGVQALSLWKWLYDAEEFSKFGIAHDLGFASEKLAMVLDGPWNLPRYRQMRNVDWAVAPLPAGPAGRATYIAGEQLAMFKQSTHRKEAWAFVKWIVQKDVQARFSMLSGYLPVRRSVLEMDDYRSFLLTDPALKAFVDQMRDGRGRQTAPAHRVEINRLLAEAIERATLGKQDPRECLDRAAAEANRLLQR